MSPTLSHAPRHLSSATLPVLQQPRVEDPFLRKSLGRFEDKRFVDNGSCSATKEFDPTEGCFNKTCIVFEHNLSLVP